MQPVTRYYKVDNRALSYADCWYLTRSPAFLFLAIPRLFRIPMQIYDGFLPEPLPLAEQLAQPIEVSAEAQAVL